MKRVLCFTVMIVGLVLSSCRFIFPSCSYVVLNYKKSDTGISFNIGDTYKQLQFYNDAVVRITVSKSDVPPKQQSLVVIANPVNINYDLKETGKELIITTKKLRIYIDKSNGAVSFFDLSGKIFLMEDHAHLPVLKDTLLDNGKVYSVKQSFKLTPDEGLYGLGQFQNGYMNYRNKDLLLVQANTTAIVQFLISTNNYGILWDNYSKSKFHDGADETFFWSQYADQVDYYFVSGENVDNVISGYRLLSGKAPMFSKSAYGYWQSKERYESFDELIDVVKKYREKNIPLDNIVQDWRYWKDGWSSMFFDPVNFPDPESNIKKLHDLNVKFMVSIWPSLGQNTDIYREMDKNGFLYDCLHWAKGRVYDAYNSKAREIYWKYIREGLADKGVDAYWMDGTEPEIGSTATQEVTEKEILKCKTTYLGPVAKYLNPYSLLTTEAVYKSHREYTDAKRVFILTRSSFAGQQRNAAVTWSGDIAASWNVFRTQIPAGINFCMAGIPYWTHDIGAFFLSGKECNYNGGLRDPAYRELYVRWFQFGCFSPIFRSHGTGTPREIWRFDNSEAPMYDALVKFDNIRYRLMPYIYSLAWKVTNENYTIMRGMMMDFPEDKQTYNMGDQYMFGPSILVKPVTKEMYFSLLKEGEVIPAECLFTPEGTNGLHAEYYTGVNFDKLAVSKTDNVIAFNWQGGPPEGVSENYYSIRWQGELVAPGDGEYEIGITADDGVRLWIDDQLIVDAWMSQAPSYYFKKMDFVKNSRHKVKIEYFQGKGGASIRLTWKNPDDLKKQNSAPPKEKTDEVYLPKSEGWYDFWTGKYYKGGQTIKKEFPISIMPLFIKAGSIIPVGPFIQYASEKPADPLEIRIYPGADAEFNLYEDEGDNYNYEKGMYSTISFKWDDKNKILTIGDRKGKFQGMLEKRIFKIIMMNETNTNGIEIPSKFDKEINYTGELIIVQLNK